jgi:5-formyltetrahydrofolate cyclo-ligase
VTGPEVAVAAAKRELRAVVRRRRAARTADQRRRDDEQRCARLTQLLTARPVRRLAAYLSAGSEPDSRSLLAWSVANDIEVLLPVLTDGTGTWLPGPAWGAYRGPDALREGRSQILEPTGPLLGDDALATVDLLVVPGLAADPHGNRLGRGGGWYDRARAARPGLETWLLLNDDEAVEVVPTERWDLPVDLLVTPGRAQRTGRGGGAPGTATP